MWSTHAELVDRSERAERAGQCTSHARRYEHADPAASPPPAAVARWTGPNGAVDLLCPSCFASWRANADEDPGLAPLGVVDLI